MKPLFLEIQAFGPFVEKQTVDFEKLSESGIFLIKGETGSGKTTIFDAMCFALYGKSSGESSDKAKVGRNDLAQWRCNQAGDKIPTVVSLTFEANSKKYVFTRKLVRKTKNLTPVYECSEIDDEGNAIALFTNPKEKALNDKAEELIGLTREQFCQVVLLPQGKFERFLTAESADKEAILRSIFNTGNWNLYTTRMVESARAKEAALKAIKTSVENSLADEGVESVEALEVIAENKKQELSALEEAHKEFKGEEKQKALDADKELSLRFAALHGLEKTAEKLAGEKDVIESKKQQHALAMKAEALRVPIDDAKKAEDNLNARRTALELLEKQLPNANAKKKAAEEAYEKAKNASPVAALQTKTGELSAKTEVYSNIDGLKSEADKAAKHAAEAEKASKTAEKALDAAAKAAAAALADYNFASENAKNLRNRYYAGIYGQIASELTEGEKCPVCGSTHHPEPAQKAPDSVSKAQVDKAESDADAEKAKWDSFEEKRKTAEETAKKLKEEFSNAQTAAAAAKSAWESAKGSLIGGIADSKALNAAIKKCKADIDAYNKELEKLESEKKQAHDSLQTLLSGIENAKKELENAETSAKEAGSILAAALAENGFDSAESVKPLLLSEAGRNALHAAIVEYATNLDNNSRELKTKTEELKSFTEPDSSQFEQRRREIKEESENYSKTSGILKKEIERLELKHKDLAKREARYKDDIIRAQEDVRFAEKLNGRTGVGLERYVLAIMFNQVLGEANRMLANMHGGRYHLLRSKTADGAGNKAGLDLLVHDNRSPEQEGRSVRMLSGGEKFLVSLALSIGLSTFAKKSGVHIEALFIDEGFGTLDDSSINDAMTILESVRGKSGMIGIISHVALLEGTIGTHLEVVKEEKGSHIKPV